MNPQDFEFIASMVKEKSGLVLTEDKVYLLDNRLMPLARNRSIEDLAGLVAKLRTNDAALITEVVEALTTNESLFFRDTHPFETFRDKIVPELLQSNSASKSFRIWCAAASSGQESYSLIMTLNEMAAQLPGWRYELVGTDISLDILEKAKSGRYTQFEVQRGMPITMLVKYFDKEGEHWVFKPEFRKLAQFKFFNLLDPLSSLGKFDVVFCRNVLIYFDAETKKKILEQIADMLPDHGKLFLGGAETVIGITDRFTTVPGCRGVYQKTG